MNFLAESDDSYAATKADVLRAEIFCKRVRARAFMMGTGGADARKANAEQNGDVIAADEELINATISFETLKAKRQRAELLIEVWRSINASQRKGNV